MLPLLALPLASEGRASVGAVLTLEEIEDHIDIFEAQVNKISRIETDLKTLKNAYEGYLRTRHTGSVTRWNNNRLAWEKTIKVLKDAINLNFHFLDSQARAITPNGGADLNAGGETSDVFHDQHAIDLDAFPDRVDDADERVGKLFDTLNKILKTLNVGLYAVVRE